MARLSSDQKSFIVNALARFHAPSEVVTLVKDEFDIEVSRQQVDYYNPKTGSSSDHLADRWKELFEAVRAGYIEGQIEVAIAHERWRLEQLEQIVRDRMERKDHRTAMKALKQAARERGKAFTNVRDVQSRGEQVTPPNIYVYGGRDAPIDSRDEKQRLAG